MTNRLIFSFERVFNDIKFGENIETNGSNSFARRIAIEKSNFKTNAQEYGYTQQYFCARREIFHSCAL